MSDPKPNDIIFEHGDKFEYRDTMPKRITRAMISSFETQLFDAHADRKESENG